MLVYISMQALFCDYVNNVMRMVNFRGRSTPNIRLKVVSYSYFLRVWRSVTPKKPFLGRSGMRSVAIFLRNRRRLGTCVCFRLSDAYLRRFVVLEGV